MTLAFEFRHDSAYWYLDDVFVYAGATQKLSNTGFETGSVSPWVVSFPHGSCGSASASTTTSMSKTGMYSIWDGSTGCADRISQQFSAVAGQVYIVSFWLASGTLSSTSTANVTLS